MNDKERFVMLKQCSLDFYGNFNPVANSMNKIGKKIRRIHQYAVEHINDESCNRYYFNKMLSKKEFNEMITVCNNMKHDIDNYEKFLRAYKEKLYPTKTKEESE